MTRSQLITKVANDTGLTATAVEKVMDGIFGTIGDVLRNGEKVTIAGFGRFEMRERQTKNFTNPKTKVTSQLQPTAIPGFKASGRLKERSPSKRGASAAPADHNSKQTPAPAAGAFLRPGLANFA